MCQLNKKSTGTAALGSTSPGLGLCSNIEQFERGDTSKNNAWVAALTFGEGWHNNHHAFPNSAKQGLFRGQIDITWEHIKILAKFGLAKKVKLPSRSYY